MPASSITKLSLTNDDPMLDAIATCICILREDGSPIGRVLEIDVADKSYKAVDLVRGVNNSEPTWAVGETHVGKYHSIGRGWGELPSHASEYLRKTYPALAAGLSII